MPNCFDDPDRKFIVDQLLSDKIDEETDRAIDMVMDIPTCGVVPMAKPAIKAPVISAPPEPPPLPPPGERAYKTPRHAFMSVCLRGPKKGGCGKGMSECSELWKEGKKEKPC